MYSLNLTLPSALLWLKMCCLLMPTFICITFLELGHFKDFNYSLHFYIVVSCFEYQGGVSLTSCLPRQMVFPCSPSFMEWNGMLLTVYNNELIMGAWEWGREGERKRFSL